MKNGQVVKIKKFEVTGKSGLAKIVNEIPNAYGLIKVYLYAAKGFPSFNDYGFYSPSELTIVK
jgi:hypothetical protein